MAEGIIADIEASGIYQIRNTINGKQYIGSAKCFRIRWNVHRSALRKGRHHSRHLQASWNKHGEDSFELEIIELCDKDHLLEREQFWLDSVMPEFNICPTAGNTLGRRFTEDTKEKIRAKAIGRKVPPRSAEYRAKISARFKGRMLSEEHMAALQAGRAKRVYTDEQREAARLATKQRYESGQFSRERPDEYRRKIADSLRGRVLPQEVKDKISAAQKGIKKGPRGPMPIDIRKAMSPLAEEKVTEILMMRINGESCSQIAVKAGVSRQKVQDICSRKRYDWVAPHLVVPSFRVNPWNDECYKNRMKAIHRSRHERKRTRSED